MEGAATKYIAHVREIGTEVRWVLCAEELHNTRAILLDHRMHGESLWIRFSGR